MRELRTEVLVVGAGPVGLCTALLLAEAGIETVIIDRETRTAARSYACALHPGSLELLDRLGWRYPHPAATRQAAKASVSELRRQAKIGRASCRERV